MIDLLIALFYLLYTSEIIQITQILTTNLLLLGLCRGLYIITYFFNTRGKKSFTRDEVISFGLKQVIVLLFGILYLPITVLTALYSLLVSGNYLKQMGEHRNSKILRITGNILTIVLPLIGIGWFVLSEDYWPIAGIGVALLAFLHYGLRKSVLTLSEPLEEPLKVGKLPKSVYYALLITLLILPSAFIIGAVVYNPPEKQTVFISMRDGVKLATDIYLAPGSFGVPRPVILVRSTYGKAGMAMLGTLYQIQGYHLVVQDCRGCFDSEDHKKFLVFQKAFQDGVDTINWILDQSWCNGKIASMGASALAINTFYFAGMNPRGLVSQTLMVGTPDLYKTSLYQGGAFKEYLVTSWIEGVAPENYEYQLEMFTKYSKKESFYNTTSLFMEAGPNFRNVNVTAIHVGGWYDLFQQGTLDGYIGYDDLGMEGARGKQLLIMGPFTHVTLGSNNPGELVYPENAKELFNMYLDWERQLFDHSLLGMPFDWTNFKRVCYYMMGDVDDPTVDANEWRYADDWPIPHANDTWYLTADGLLSKSSPGTTNKNYSYIYDPRNPVPTVGGLNLGLPSGPYDQRSIENRSDVLIFETPVLTEKVNVVGHMWAHLFVASNCTNTDFTVKITDVYPDGRSMLINDGIINAIRRDGVDKDAAPLNESEPVEVVIDLWSTAYQFNIGHKIRVAISSSNYPRFAINPNTGAPQTVYSYQYLTRNIAYNTILVGSDYPSYILLPRPIS
ncbi:MAG: CocE/NonD family hydrolase [Candidatus Hodarchaeota archaeon]